MGLNSVSSALLFIIFDKRLQKTGGDKLAGCVFQKSLKTIYTVLTVISLHFIP